MRRRLLLLNLVLVALVAAAAWQLRVRWLDERAQERSLLRQPATKADVAPAAALRPPPPLSAASYGEVAQKTLFSEDRNPNVTVEVAPPKPVPAFPQAYGVADFGSGPTVFLSAKPGGQSRGYSPGEKVGEFTLVAVGKDELVLEWNDQKFTKKVQDLKPSAGEQRSAAVAKTSTPSAAPVQAVNAVVEEGPGPQVSDTSTRACQAGDPSPAGTVRDGYRKVMNRTPFGSTCHWEPVK